MKNCSEPCLIYSATSRINAIELTTSRIVQLVSNLSTAYALDVHVSEKMIYWSDTTQRVIQRMNLTSGQIEDIIKDDLGNVMGLAVDWESNLIYWTDLSNRRIEVASLDGKNRKLLLGADREEINTPRGIALYPKKGWVPKLYIYIYIYFFFFFFFSGAPNGKFRYSSVEGSSP